MPVRRAGWILWDSTQPCLTWCRNCTSRNWKTKKRKYSVKEQGTWVTESLFKWTTPAAYTRRTGRRVASDKQNGKSK